MKKFLGNWWVLSGLIVLLLVLVLCLGLPIFVRMLSPWWVRLLLLAVIVVPWGVFGWWRMRKMRNAAAAIAAELSAPAPGDAEGQAVSARMAEALASLRTGAGKRRDYLYNRPWYVIIGPPGAGKTTALLNSGLRFPLSDQSFKGVGGTRNLDFWFADEAIMVDTAGRYTTQDSDTAADAKGWTSFLSLMRKHRPLSPINGVIVAIGVDELLQADRAGLDRHASLVRRRLTEVRATLEVSVPVYLLLTNADLIAGFSEFYDDLDVEGRRAVLGATFPVEVKRPSGDDLVGAFDAVVSAQQARQAKRLFEEVDQTRRSLILGFPAQLGALRTRLARFYARQSKVKEAEEEYLAALNLDASISPRVDLADFYRAVGREADSEALLRQTIAMEPLAAAPQHALGLAMIRAKRYQDALGALKQAHELEPTQPRYSYVYAIALESMGRTPDALQLLQATLQSSPSNVDTLRALLRLSLASRDYANALGYAQRLANLLPDDASLAPLVKQLQQRQR